MPELITRAEYMSEVASYDKYYGQFLNDGVVQLVKDRFGKRLRESKDTHFNDIPLHEWDGLAESLRLGFPDTMRKVSAANGGGGTTLCDRVCVLKRAATRIRDGA